MQITAFVINRNENFRDLKNLRLIHAREKKNNKKYTIDKSPVRIYKEVLKDGSARFEDSEEYIKKELKNYELQIMCFS